MRYYFNNSDSGRRATIETLSSGAVYLSRYKGGRLVFHSRPASMGEAREIATNWIKGL